MPNIDTHTTQTNACGCVSCCAAAEVHRLLSTARSLRGMARASLQELYDTCPCDASLLRGIAEFLDTEGGLDRMLI
jgi:hypothetical protein